MSNVAQAIADRCVVSADGCWLWAGRTAGKGYGQRVTRGRRSYVHRDALEWRLGRKLKTGELALHSCDRPACVNPNHLRPGSKSDNALDAVERGQMACAERSPNAKLTIAQVLAVRSMRGVKTVRETASEFRISGTQVHRIWHRTHWSRL